MRIGLKEEVQWTSRGFGPYTVITVLLDNDEVPAADAANSFAQMIVDFIVSCFPLATAIASILTAIYGKLTPDIAKGNRGYGVIVVTNVPTGGIGVPYSTVTPREASAGFGILPPNFSPSLAVFDDRLWASLIANDGSNIFGNINTNNVQMCSSADGRNWSGKSLIGQTALHGSSPSLAVFKSRLWVSFVANNDTHNILVCSSADGQNWSSNTPIGQTAQSTSSPSFAVFKSRLWVSFVANNDTHNILVCSSADGQNWSNNTPIGQTAQNDASPFLAVFGNSLWASFVAKNGTCDRLICSSGNGQNWSNNSRI
jgi:predicted cupin superfamily sugar epimerase